MLSPRNPPQASALRAASVRNDLIWFLIQATLLFWAAGRLNYWQGWLFLALLLAQTAMSLKIMWAVPGLGEERSLADFYGSKILGDREVAQDALVHPPDRILTEFFLITQEATYIVGALDAGRLRWPDTLPPACQAIGVLAYAMGAGLFLWAMSANRFFSVLLRIQKERGHVATMSGPYSYLRHPGYAGTILMAFATPLLLGSAYAFIPAALNIAATAARTAMEDDYLKRKLQNYRPYAEKVRYKLLPGVY